MYISTSCFEQIYKSLFTYFKFTYVFGIIFWDSWYISQICLFMSQYHTTLISIDV